MDFQIINVARLDGGANTAVTLSIWNSIVLKGVYGC